MRPDLHYSRYERAANAQGCYTVVQMARLLGVTDETVVNWCDARKIACLRWGPHLWRIIPRTALARAFTLVDHRRGRRGRTWDQATEPKAERSMKVQVLG